jgi:hypothetical protein
VQVGYLASPDLATKAGKAFPSLKYIKFATAIPVVRQLIHSCWQAVIHQLSVACRMPVVCIVVSVSTLLRQALGPSVALVPAFALPGRSSMYCALLAGTLLKNTTQQHHS